MVKTTRKQREALFSIFRRDWPSWVTPFRRHTGTRCPHCGSWTGLVTAMPSTAYRNFRRQAQPSWDGSGCVMLPWHGMWLGIETDGYTHS
jgi:hypothetical protein